LSYTSLYFSGQLNMAWEIYKEKGEVTKEDFVRICARYGYGNNENYESYWFNVQALFKQYKELLGMGDI